MKKNLIPFALAALTLGFTGCSDDSNDSNGTSKYITVSTQIKTRMGTNASGTQIFTNGDQISVYAWTGDASSVPAADGRVVDNSINTLSGDKWTAAPQMLWKNTTDKHYFIGVYPKNDASVADLTAGDYTLDVTNQEKSDLLVACRLNGITSENNPVLLTFDHVMAKLIVNLQYRNQWGGTPTVESVTVNNAATTAKVNYLTRSVTASDTRSSIALPVTTANEKYTSIFIPQTDVKSIAIRINGKDYTYTNNAGINLESGKITTVNLIVGRDEITLGEVSINDWAQGTEISGGEAQE